MDSVSPWISHTYHCKNMEPISFVSVECHSGSCYNPLTRRALNDYTVKPIRRWKKYILRPYGNEVETSGFAYVTVACKCVPNVLAANNTGFEWPFVCYMIFQVGSEWYPTQKAWKSTTTSMTSIQADLCQVKIIKESLMWCGQGKKVTSSLHEESRSSRKYNNRCSRGSYSLRAHIGLSKVICIKHRHDNCETITIYNTHPDNKAL